MKNLMREFLNLLLIAIVSLLVGACLIAGGMVNP